MVSPIVIQYVKNGGRTFVKNIDESFNLFFIAQRKSPPLFQLSLSRSTGR